MLKVKTFFFLFLPLLFVFLLPLTASAAIIDEPTRQEYGQNNIIFYRYCDPDNEAGCSYFNTGSTTPTDSTDDSSTDDTADSDTPSITGSCGCPDGCGKQNNTGMESQGTGDSHSPYSGVTWRTKDDSDISSSGCSLVAVVNASNTLGQSNNIKDVAAWSRENVYSGGWDTSIKPLAEHLSLELIGLFDNVHSGGKKVSTTSEKLTLIKQALASGKVVIASGEVPNLSKTDEFGAYCGNRAKARGVDGTTFANQGNCVFTPGGHFVAIIGVTKDNKLVVANPALGSKSATGWIFPADNVLEFADIAMAAGTKGSGGLISCSGSSSATPSTPSSTTPTSTTETPSSTPAVSKYTSPAASTGPTTTWSFKGTKFTIVNTKTSITDYATYAQSSGVKQDANEAKWGGSCMGFAETFGYDMYKGTTHTGTEANAYKCSSIWKYKEYSNKSDLLATIYNQIKAGKPVVLHVSSKTRTTSRHFVTVVGFKASVSSASSLKESDLLIMDAWDAELERMDGVYPSSPRVITTGKQTGRSYDGYYAATIR